jgi:hypothetical protein
MTEEGVEATRELMRTVKEFSSAANNMVGAARATIRSEEKVR